MKTAAEQVAQFNASKIKKSIDQKLKLVLVTTRRWDQAPLMYGGMHFFYEGTLAAYNQNEFTMTLAYPDPNPSIEVKV
jgi:hypothetical protein